MNTNPIIDTLALLAANPCEGTVELRRNLRLVAQTHHVELVRPKPIILPDSYKGRYKK